MDTEQIVDQVAIVGVGNTAVDRNPATDMAALSISAFRNALDDSGLTRDDIDGLIIGTGAPDDLNYQRLSISLGLKNVRWGMETHRHGRMFTALVAQAAM